MFNFLQPHGLRLLIFLLEILIPVFASSSPAFLIPGSERTDGEGIGYSLQYSWASLVVELVKNLPSLQETWVQSLGWEDLLEKGKVTHSSILVWRILWTV